jgi:hypothetical protein
VSELTPDPRDPLGLRADAPMLAAWLDFTRQAEDGELLVRTEHGHLERVVGGDVTLEK